MKIVIGILIVLLCCSLTVSHVRANTTCAVEWYAEDTITRGDWYFNPVGSPIGVYGSYAHILPNAPNTRIEDPIGNYSVPAGEYSDPPYSWTSEQISGVPFHRADPPYWDEYVSKDPAVTYYVNGTRVAEVKYPVFEWAWEDWHSSQTDPREVYYTTTIAGTGGGPGWRLVSWDDGGERCLPTHGYMNFTLTFPSGSFLLSLYAYDYEMANRESLEYRIYDETGVTLLASKQISGTAFDEGVYEIFKVEAPPEGCTIIVQVYNDAGHPDPNNNVNISGIFVDKLAPPPSVGGEGEVIPVGQLTPLNLWMTLVLLTTLTATMLLVSRRRTHRHLNI